MKFVKVASYCVRQKTASLPNYQQGLEAVLAAYGRSDAIHVQSSRVQAISRAGKWSWTLKRAQERSRGGRWSQAQKVGLLLLQLFLNTCATDMVLATLLRTAVETATA